MTITSLRNFCLLGLLLLAAACKDDKDPEKEPYDRQTMLQDLGNKVILPNYQNLKAKTDLMQTAISQFTATPNSVTLINARAAFRESYIAWQYVSALEFGPAEQQMLRMYANIFPADTTFIKNKIAAAGAPTAYAEMGFPALDYLLFARKNETQLLALYANANQKKYLNDVVADLKTRIDATVNAWSPAGGNYLNTFVTTTGTDVGSSTGQYVNQLNADFEIIKTAKIGIPLGKKTLGTPRPQNSEAYYSGYSKVLMLENVKATRNLYSGTDLQGNNHTGLDDYLNYLEAKSADGRNLTEAIDQQFTTILNSINAIPEPFSQAVLNVNGPAETAYNDVRNMVVYLKTDMPSAMGILITYQDNDGD